MGDLTTYANVKAFLGLSVDTDKGLLERLITAASSFIQTIVNRDITKQIYTEKYNGNGHAKLPLSSFPITAISSLSVDGIAVPLSSDGIQAGYIFSETMVYLIGYTFTKGFQNVAISYTAGYENVPYDIEQACIDLVALKYKERERIGIQSKTLATETVTYRIWDLNKETKQILKEYEKVTPT
jgi:hypothetical protein